MSAFSTTADIGGLALQVRYVPTGDSCTAAKELLSDHLVTRAGRAASPGGLPVQRPTSGRPANNVPGANA